MSLSRIAPFSERATPSADELLPLAHFGHLAFLWEWGRGDSVAARHL